MNQFHTMPPAEYYADPCARPSLSQSTAHTLISRSPLHAYRQHPRLGGQAKATTPAMDKGTIIHSLVFDGEGSCSFVELLPHEDYRKKDAQADRDAAIAAGKTPVLMREWLTCKDTAKAIKQQLDAFGIRFDGQSEAVGLWTERTDEGEEVLCRCRIDHWAEPVIYDLKTTSDATRSKCERSIEDHGYDIQAAAYISAAEKSFPELVGRVRFVNIFVETEEPYLVHPIEQKATFLSVGRSKWRRAINLWAKCLRENNWPGYATEIARVDAPPWAINRELEISPYANSIQQECPL